MSKRKAETSLQKYLIKLPKPPSELINPAKETEQLPPSPDTVPVTSDAFNTTFVTVTGTSDAENTNKGIKENDVGQYVNKQVPDFVAGNLLQNPWMPDGWPVAVSLENINQIRCNIFHYSAITAGIMASAAFVYAFLEAIGTDPMLTINKATKWCTDQSYIHQDTTPLYCMMRYCGFMLGMGFGFNSSYFEKNYPLQSPLKKRLLCALLSVAICLLSEKIIFNKESLILYYFQAFVRNTVLAYIIIAVIPTATNAIWTLKKKE